jgi:hypothetical protein
MSRLQSLLLIVTLAVAFLCAAVATTLAGGADNLRAPAARDRISDGEALPSNRVPVEVAAKPKPGKVVCPAIILKVGPNVMLPCARGAKILDARSVEVDGRYWARVTYIAEKGPAPRTETLCPGDVPSVGGLVD